MEERYLQGFIGQSGSISGYIQNSKKLTGTARTTGVNLIGTASSSAGGSGHIPEYNGPYEATPSLEIQTLYTKSKKMKNNVTVNATPLSEVSNESGGYTVTIL